VLDCSGHKITELKLGDHLQLEYLRCDNNQITELNISNCPDLTEFYCSGNQLANLNISNCPQITKLNFSNNLLTSFDFYELNESELTHLGLRNNNFSRRDLSELTPFVNLESIDVGRDDNQSEIKRGRYNRFYGSLEPLKNMTKLKFLSIEATDIDSGLEYLPESLEEFYCVSYGTSTKVRKIEESLKNVPLQEVFAPSETVVEDIILVKNEEKETISLPELSNFLESLQK